MAGSCYLSGETGYCLQHPVPVSPCGTDIDVSSDWVWEPLMKGSHIFSYRCGYQTDGRPVHVLLPYCRRRARDGYERGGVWDGPFDIQTSLPVSHPCYVSRRRPMDGLRNCSRNVAGGEDVPSLPRHQKRAACIPMRVAREFHCGSDVEYFLSSRAAEAWIWERRAVFVP